MKAYLILFTGILFLFSCTDPSKNNGMPEIKDCDSATIMYYKTPGNPRFFLMAKIKDMESLDIITADANGKIITGKDSCISNGKIFFYGKGEAVYPVYFSTVEDCMTFSFIKTGEKYFTRMGPGSKIFLDKIQLTAKEPGSEQ
ncbi:MAG: hypothetical protein IPL50_01970 [Chitinophagaceae bacterium]|nr:hypothetical protein [Chitinophagaceae bacterium]